MLKKIEAFLTRGGFQGSVAGASRCSSGSPVGGWTQCPQGTIGPQHGSPQWSPCWEMLCAEGHHPDCHRQAEGLLSFVGGGWEWLNGCWHLSGFLILDLPLSVGLFLLPLLESWRSFEDRW